VSKKKLIGNLSKRFSSFKLIRSSGIWSIISLAVILLSLVVGISSVQQKQIYRPGAQTSSSPCNICDPYGICFASGTLPDCDPILNECEVASDCLPCYLDRECAFDEICVRYECIPKEKTGTLEVDSNLCIVKSGEVFCTIIVNWTVQKTIPEDEIALLLYKDPISVIPLDSFGSQSGAYHLAVYPEYGQYRVALTINSDIVDEIILSAVHELDSGKTGQIWSSNYICSIPAGEDSCFTSVIWATQNVASDDEVTLIISSEGGISFGQTINPSGSYGFSVIGSEGQYKAELRINYQAVDEIFLSAIAENEYPTGNLSANPNQCIISEGNSSCEILVSWFTQNTEGLELRFGVHTEKSDILPSASGIKSYLVTDKGFTGLLFAGIDPDYIILDSIELRGVGGAPTGIPISNPNPGRADINSDSVVNILDYQILSNNFSTSDSDSDINEDGVVNILDFQILSNNFGSI